MEGKEEGRIRTGKPTRREKRNGMGGGGREKNVSEKKTRDGRREEGKWNPKKKNKTKREKELIVVMLMLMMMPALSEFAWAWA